MMDGANVPKAKLFSFVIRCNDRVYTEEKL